MLPNRRSLSFSAVTILQALASGYRYGFDVMDATVLPSGTVYPSLSRLCTRACSRTSALRAIDRTQLTTECYPPDMATRSFAGRLKGALLLDASVYEDVEADQSAFSQAVATVVLSSVAAGVGMGLRDGIRGLVAATAVALIAWFFWAWLTYFIGTHLLPTPRTSATWGELLRTTGFSAAPGTLRIFSMAPGVGALLNYVAGVWMLVAFVVAVRQALDYESTWRAVFVCLTGWFVYVFVSIFLTPFAF